MRFNLRGFKAVFGFSFKQSADTVSFKLTTVIVAILLAGALILVNIFGARSAKPEEDSAAPAPATGVIAEPSQPLLEVLTENIIVFDESGIGPIDFAQLLNGNTAFKAINFSSYEGTDIKEAVKSTDVTDKTLLLHITKEDGKYLMETILPSESLITGNEAEVILNQLIPAFEAFKMDKAGLAENQVSLLTQPVGYTVSSLGEEEDMANMIVKMLAPMAFSFMLYFMLIFYGQQISKSVSGEKTSKLVETLLVSVRPEALIAGKVLAVATQGVLQFTIWIVALIGGLYGGNFIAASMYPGYTNPVITFIDLLKDTIGQSALSLPAAVISILFFFFGFLFYSLLAALAGSMVSKPEDVASTQGIITLPIVISFMLSYFVPLSGNESFTAVARYIPFTAPFIVPVDLLTGLVSIPHGLLLLAVMILFTVIMVNLSARIFKGLILYNGQKITFRTIKGVISGKQ
ncbi:MAG: ABC-type Na+ efflux pump permease component-like protein [Anaerocolumna sp.]|jgi:ABC-type Na+ efflux pump permease subunit|nr:ABC-type Na+ efflux pump permease component-like protein [Anaerocolumna sp.]